MRFTIKLSVPWVRRLLQAVMTIACVVPAWAGEVETECPMKHPEKPAVRFHAGECLPDGEAAWTHIPDQIMDHGNSVFTAVQIHKTPSSPPLRKAKIECVYRDKSVILIAVPGELLRCAIRYREPIYKGLGTDGKDVWVGEWETFRVWAVSEKE